MPSSVKAATRYHTKCLAAAHHKATCTIAVELLVTYPYALRPAYPLYCISAYLHTITACPISNLAQSLRGAWPKI